MGKGGGIKMAGTLLRQHQTKKDVSLFFSSKTSSVVECISLLESGFACVILLTYFGQLHQRVHLFLRPFKVLDAKCIYGHHFHS